MNAPTDRSGCVSTLPDARTDVDPWMCSQPDCILDADGHDLTLLLQHELGITVDHADEARAVILATLAHECDVTLDALRAIA